MTPALVREKYARILAACEEQAMKWSRTHAYYGHDEVTKLYERVFGAYELALGIGVDPGESPSAWAERVTEQIRKVA